MALFSGADLVKTKYIVALIGEIKAGKPIKVKADKKMIDVKFEYNADIKAIEKVHSDPAKYKKIIYPGNKYAPVFVTKKDGAFQWNQIDKQPFSKMGGSRNALGKALADAGELATVMSLSKDIKTAKDTGQKIFIDHADAFAAWLPTFKYTRPAIEKIVGPLGAFVVLHDATDKSDFSKAITSFCKKIKVAKDSWNPADIFIINKSKLSAITKELQNIVDTYDEKDGLVDMFNKKLYDFYLKKQLYPISLKQLTTEKPSVDYANEPGKVKVASYKIEINNINVNLAPEGKELGLFTFKNVDTNKIISLQVRGFPHGYGTAQTEITSDGSPTGGRLGKISTAIVDRVLGEYDASRIDSISFFGKAPKYFGEFDEKKTKEVYGWYTTVVKHKNVKDQSPMKYDEFKKLITKAQNDIATAETMCMKIQGLKMAYEFVSNEKHLSAMMNKLINGAKKVSSDNGFFIKIY